jgi:hypothetical protein
MSNRYKITWEEQSNRHGGIESSWNVVDAKGYVEANTGGQAIRFVKGALGSGHFKRYKCRNFKAVKK